MRLCFVSVLMGLTCLVPPNSEAQNGYWGLRMGMARTQVEGVTASYALQRAQAALFLYINVPRFTGVQFEVGYAPRGYGLQIDSFRDNEGNVLIEDFEATYQLEYLDIPVLLSMELPVGGALEVHALVGPYMAFLVKNTQDLLETGSLDRSEIADIDFNQIDAGLQFGARLGYPLRNTLLGIDLRYTLGVVNAYPDGISATESIQNRGFTIALVLGRRI